MIYGNIVGTNNGGIGKSFVIKDENGNEAVAVMVEEETEFTATANDIREGVVAATDSGVTEGTKYIPSYNTSEGIQIIPANQSLYIRIKDYEYTKLQAVVCPFNSSMTNSVSTEKVVIEDNVEVGANTCIDRATMGATTIHNGVKIDNLVQIAHNDEIGSHTAMAAQVGIAGSTKIGQWCIFGGQAGISGHSTIGDRTTVGPQCGTIGNLESGRTVLGSPAINAKEYIRLSAYMKRLPEMDKKIKELTRQLEALKNK